MEFRSAHAPALIVLALACGGCGDDPKPAPLPIPPGVIEQEFAPETTGAGSPDRTSSGVASGLTPGGTSAASSGTAERDDPDAPPPPPMSWSTALERLAADGDWTRGPELRAVAEAVSTRLPAFEFRSIEVFGNAADGRRVAVLLHRPTGLEFSLIPGGRYRSGSPDDEVGRANGDPLLHERPTQRTVPRGFLIARTETTQAAWTRLGFENVATIPDAQRPIVNVSWDEAQAFCKKAGLELPPELLWEYACRAGTQTRFSTGDDHVALAAAAWFADNAESTSKRVATRAANPFGLFDMHGNVLEWCADPPSSAEREFRPQPELAADSLTSDALTAETNERLCRGGSWFNDAAYCRSAARSKYPRDTRSRAIGFRPIARLPLR